MTYAQKIETLKHIRNRYEKTIGSLKANRALPSEVEAAHREVEALNHAIKLMEENE